MRLKLIHQIEPYVLRPATALRDYLEVELMWNFAIEEIATAEFGQCPGQPEGSQELPMQTRACIPGSWAIASDAVVAVELGREMGSSVGSGAASPSLPSSMVNLIGGKMDAEIRVGIGAIGAIDGKLSARAAANMDAVVGMYVSSSSRLG
ncbi:hypothetical protein SCAR479_13120 [Seiridium cardinale]|uniref:Uncharacterized protein n=1 Tax=Seiridium cardinale TaxID=138064 RepID=A0ABR2X8Y1_9PEZI